MTGRSWRSGGRKASMRSRVSLSDSMEPPLRVVEAAWGDEGLHGPGLWLREDRRGILCHSGDPNLREKRRACREAQALPRGCCHLLEKKQPPPHTQDRTTNQTNARM